MTVMLLCKQALKQSHSVRSFSSNVKIFLPHVPDALSGRLIERIVDVKISEKQKSELLVYVFRLLGSRIAGASQELDEFQVKCHRYGAFHLIRLTAVGRKDQKEFCEFRFRWFKEIY